MGDVGRGGPGGGGPSAATRREVEGEVAGLLRAAYARVRTLLSQHEQELHALARELLDKETLTGDEVKQLLQRLKDGKVEREEASEAASAAVGSPALPAARALVP